MLSASAREVSLHRVIEPVENSLSQNKATGSDCEYRSSFSGRAQRSMSYGK